jgi:hypothetical protein
MAEMMSLKLFEKLTHSPLAPWNTAQLPWKSAAVQTKLGFT